MPICKLSAAKTKTEQYVCSMVIFCPEMRQILPAAI